jgi:cell wall-associated NlpC family hydrolase
VSAVNTCAARRCLGAATIVLSITTVSVAGFGQPAHADPVTDKQAQARTLSAQIDALGNKEEALSEQYDKAVLDAHTTAAQVQQASAAVEAAQTNAAKAQRHLRSDAVDAYVHGGTLAQMASRADNPAAVNSAVLRGEYVKNLAATQSDALDAYRSAILTAKEAEASLRAAHQQARKAVADVDGARNATAATHTRLEASLSQVKGQIAILVAQADTARRAQQAKQAAAVLARQAEPTLQGSAGRGSSALTIAPTPPPLGHGAGAAVAAALSRIGSPYVWGAAGPNTFDCSGLVMWSYAHAGIALPHYSGAQYASTQHIAISQLQPGDLVFPADPGEHVAMYTGGGQIVVAPHTGTTVQVEPLSSWYVLASRP